MVEHGLPKKKKKAFMEILNVSSMYADPCPVIHLFSRTCRSKCHKAFEGSSKELFSGVNSYTEEQLYIAAEVTWWFCWNKAWPRMNMGEEPCFGPSTDIRTGFLKPLCELVEPQGFLPS